MLTLAQWLSGTAVSLAFREVNGLVLALQTVHIFSIALMMSSFLMIELRVLNATRSQSIADTMHRFEPWIRAGLVLLAASGAPLILAEPQRTLPNATFQIKMVLLVLAATATYALLMSLRRQPGFTDTSGTAALANKALAICVFVLWCAVATAGRFIAYTLTN